MGARYSAYLNQRRDEPAQEDGDIITGLTPHENLFRLAVITDGYGEEGLDSCRCMTYLANPVNESCLGPMCEGYRFNISRTTRSRPDWWVGAEYDK